MDIIIITIKINIMKFTLFLKDTNSSEVCNIDLLHHFSMFDNNIKIRLQEENLNKFVEHLLREKIKFEYDGNVTIIINTNLINFRID